MAYRDVVLADSPVDYYEMNTGTGTDSGSGSRTLTLSGVTTGVTGKVGNGWSFDGVNDFASMGTWPTLTTAFTFEAWVKPNLSGVSDTPTVIRRDGTDIMLLRVRGSALGVNPGQAEVYADGLTLVSGSSYRVDDGNWHHLAYTQSGNTAKLYVDGVERASGTTSQSTFNMGTGIAYIGAAGGTSEWYKGDMDEVAVYNTALSSARVLAHYNGTAVNAGYTAQVMTATATAPNAVGVGNVQTLAVTHDALTWDVNPNNNYGSSTTLAVTGTTLSDGSRTYVKSALPLANGESEASRILNLYLSSSASGGDISVYRVMSDWDESTVTRDSRPNLELVRSVTITTSIGWKTIDISSADIGYGVALATNSAGQSFASSENASNKPYVTLTTAPATSANYVATPATGTALVVDPAVVAGSNATITATVLTASAVVVDPVVEALAYINLTVSAEPMAAYATWPTTSGFVLPVTISHEAVTAFAEFTDATVETQRGPRIAATPLSATAEWKQPALVNDAPIVASEADDKYFQRVLAAAPKHWYRLADKGSVADDRMTTQVGSYVGVQTGRNAAPDNRHSVYFDGTAYLEQIEGGGINTDESLTFVNGIPQSTLEFSFKTEKGNTFLMAGKDYQSGSTGISEPGPREVSLRDGKISYRWYLNDGQVGGEFNGFRNLADNQWHHVVMRTAGGASNDTAGTDSGVEVWVDGTYEVRRFQGGTFNGFPDYVGSRPTSIDGAPLTPLPSSMNFVGEMSEIVFYGYRLSKHVIPRHYYDFMGWNPIEAEPVEAFAFAPVDARGKGNQKRALYLWWNPRADAFNIGGNDFSGKMNFDPVLDGKGNFGVYNLEGYKVFSKSVEYKLGPTGLTEGYRDAVTDMPALINLETDIDIEDYDVIMFGDWPDEGPEIDQWESFYPSNRERLTNQLIDVASNKGINLLVTQPRLAVDLGIIDRVEFVPTLGESKYSGFQGNALGYYDYGAAAKFPWNVSASTGLEGGSNAGNTGTEMNTNPAYLATKAYYYADRNFNNKFRVRALIDGLTNIPSYMIEDSVFHTEFDSWGLVGTVGFKYLHRLEGLQIGDEFLFHGTNATYDWGSGDLTGFRTGRPYGYYATPMANVKAGTVVTTFGTTHWKEQAQVDNPYKDFATTIVLRPGDVLKGKPINSRIFVNFTEQPNRFNLTVGVQDLPPVEGPWPVNYAPDTAAQREWEYTSLRTTISSTQVGGFGSITVVMPDGSTQTIPTSNPGGGSLIAARSNQIFPINYFPRFDMVRRGMFWLQGRVEVNEGDTTAVADPIVATAEIKEPVTVAQRDTNITATPMNALAQVTRVAESTVGDVEIRTLPATASATFTGYSKVISVAPMEATAELVESFDMVHTTGEQIVLTLHGVDATLYLKEEA